MQRLTDLVVRDAVLHLRDEYMPRIEAALQVLPPADLWWRPNDQSNSVGNLLLHLEGNVRQWILSGIGRVPDRRVRIEEFTARGSASAADLMRALRATVEDACRVIGEQDEGSLVEELTVQGFRTTVVAAIAHVVEHFSWHTGQIVWVAKARAGAEHGLAFYDDDQLNDPGGG